MRSANENKKLVHASAYYTLNEIPKPKPNLDTNKQPTDSPEPSQETLVFEKPANAVDLVNENGSRFVPESSARSQWTFKDGVLTASPKWDSVVTPQAYQDFRMHLEFNLNDAGDVPRERNANSGIYIQQRYELQILNSFGITESEYRTNDCASLYGLKKPDRLVCKPPGQWQSFDIEFQAARYEGQKKVNNARITVYHNGELVHDKVELTRKTGAGKVEEPSARPIKLQGHHNQVQFRNVWIQDLSTDEKSSIPKITASQKSLPLNGEAFQFNGRDAFIIKPRGNPKGVPWVWYAPTLPGLPASSEKWMFEKFLKAGVAIAGIDAGESYGSPTGREIYDEFYQYLVETRQLQERPCLLARSRGGLMLYNWAVENPQSVSGIAGIYPVCNLTSYPGLANACSAFAMTPEQLETELSEHNPVDRLAALAKSGVPIFHLHGDQDQVVPLSENSGLVAERYQALNGQMTLEVVKGQGHNMWEGWFQSQNLVDFVLTALNRPLDDHPVPDSELWLKFSGNKGPGNGKHIVLIAAEQEYRSEQSMPMLANILSKHHGFDCTVLFFLNEQGQVDPTLPAPFEVESKRHNIPGLEHLESADCVIWLSRFMQLPDEQLKRFHDYFDSGKPLIALRTANHGFWGGTKYFKGDRQVSLRELLGGTFMEHHGGWHRESTRGVLVEEQKTHPILIGVNEIWGPSDVYRCHNDESPLPEGSLKLVLGQPLVNLDPDAAANNEKEALPIAWTHTWKGNQGHTTKIFHFTMGSARDFANEGVRRLTINAVYWGLGIDEEITPDRSVDIVGTYEPLESGFNYKKLGVQPRKPSYYMPR